MSTEEIMDWFYVNYTVSINNNLHTGWHRQIITKRDLQTYFKVTQLYYYSFVFTSSAAPKPIAGHEFTLWGWMKSPPSSVLLRRFNSFVFSADSLLNTKLILCDWLRLSVSHCSSRPFVRSVSCTQTKLSCRTGQYWAAPCFDNLE